MRRFVEFYDQAVSLVELGNGVEPVGIGAVERVEVIADDQQWQDLKAALQTEGANPDKFKEMIENMRK